MIQDKLMVSVVYLQNASAVHKGRVLDCFNELSKLESGNGN
jgi:hypothetical protein